MQEPALTQLAAGHDLLRPPSLARGLMVGLILATALCVAEILGISRLSAASLASDYSTGWAIFGTFVLVALLNAPLRRLLPRLALNGGEIVMAYAAMIAACPLISGGFILSLIPKLAAFRYYASPANHWAEVIFRKMRGGAVPLAPSGRGLRLLASRRRA